MTAGRVALLAGAAVVALVSRGDLVLLALLLGVGSARVATGVGAALALGAAGLRWGTTSLGAVAGAQAVLGPAGFTGGASEAAGAWFGALALTVAAAPLPDGILPARAAPFVAAIPYGLTAAAVAAGPGPGGDLWIRALASVAAVGLAAGVIAGRERFRHRWFDGAAVAGGLAAVVLSGIAR